MTVTLEQIQAGIVKYIDVEIAPKANGLTKFAVYFFVPSLPKMINNKFNEYKSNPLFTDLFDENGNVELDEIYARAKEAMKHSGKVLIPQINYFIDEHDIDILYNLIKGV